MKGLVYAIVVLLLAAVLLTVGCDTGAERDTAPEDFYAGKTIHLVVSGSAGGKTDLLSRVLASCLERDSGANVVVTNKDQGGGMEGINYVYRSESDGLTLGTIPSLKFVSNKVMDEPVAVYDISDFSYVLGVGYVRYCLLVSPDGPYQSIADLQAGKDLLLGGSSPSGPTSLGGMTAIELLDLDAKVVTGFDREADRALAVARGEIDGYVLNPVSALSSIDAGFVTPLCVLGTTRDPLIPDVPAITELVDPDGGDLELAELWETKLVGSTILVAPPDIPEYRLAFLRDISSAWADDEALRQEINSVSGYEVQVYTSGDTLQASMLNLADDLDEYREVFAEMIEKHRA